MPSETLFLALEWLRVGEAKYADMADAHKERGEWEAARRAAQVSDHIRFYRLHREALDAGRLRDVDEQNVLVVRRRAAERLELYEACITDLQDRLAGIAEKRCNACGLPRSKWGPICGGMTSGDATHYHSPEWWARSG